MPWMPKISAGVSLALLVSEAGQFGQGSPAALSIVVIKLFPYEIGFNGQYIQAEFPHNQLARLSSYHHH